MSSDFYTVLASRYELFGELGRGATGRVIDGRDRRTGRPVAVKILRTDLARDRAWVERQTRRLRRELRICASLEHPNIVKLLDSLESLDGAVFGVFERAEGRTLERVLADEGALTIADACDVMGQVLDAVRHAHDHGIVHRDLKPANIMVRGELGARIAQVLDFGLSAFLEGADLGASRITKSREMVGTPLYSAPEQFDGDPAMPVSDLYAWALVFIEALTGKSPFHGLSMTEMLNHQLNDVPVAIPSFLRFHPVKPFLERAVEKKPHRRRVDVPALLGVLRAEQRGAKHEAGRISAVLAIDAGDPAWVERAARAISASVGGRIDSLASSSALVSFDEPSIGTLAERMVSAVSLAMERREEGADLGLRFAASIGNGTTSAAAAASEALGATRPEDGIFVAAGPLALALAGRFVIRPVGRSHAGEELFSVRVDPRASRVPSRFELTEPALVGRDREVELLLDRVDRVRDGEGQVVLVSGSAGMGKSRLVREVYRRAGERQQWIVLGCVEAERLSPLAPFASLLQALLDGEPSHEGIAQLVPDGDDAELDRVLLGSLLGFEASIVARDAVPAERIADATAASLRRLLERISGMGFRVLVVEDVHWADPSTRTLLERLIDEVPALPLLLLLTFRSHAWPPGGVRDLLHLPLAALRPSEARALACEHGNESHAPEVARRAGGVPLYVEELARSLKWDVVPVDLRAAVLGRIARLDAAEVLRAASVLGPEFSYELLASIHGRDTGGLESALKELIQGNLLYQRGLLPRAELGFHHELIREIVYDSIDVDRRAEWHRQVYDRLAKDPLALPELLAPHAEGAGLTDVAASCWLRAGRASARRAAYAEAAGQLERGIDLLTRVAHSRGRAMLELELRLARCHPLGHMHGFGSEPLAATLRRARELATACGAKRELIRALHGLARTQQSRGLFADSLASANEVMSIAESEGDHEARVLGTLTRAFNLTYLGRFREASEACAVGIDCVGSEPLDPISEETLVSCRSWLAFNSALRGDLETLDRAGAAALDEARLRGFSIATLLALTVNGETARLLEKSEDVLRAAREMLERTAAHNLPFWRGIGILLEGAALAALGGSSSALLRAEEGLRVWDATGSCNGRSEWLTLLCDAALDAGRIDRAQEWAEEARRHCSRFGEAFFAAEVCRVEARVARERGDASDFRRAALDAALASARSQDAILLELRAALELWNGAERYGDDASPSRLRRVVDRFAIGVDAPVVERARRLLAAA